MKLQSLCGKMDGLKRQKYQAFLLNFIAIFLVYGALLQSHFSPDTFLEYVNEESRYLWHISNGRLVYALLHRLLYVLGLRVTVCAGGYTFLFMIVSAWCASQIAFALCGAKETDDEKCFWLCDLASLISMVNFCVLEWYLFPECMLMYTIALLGATHGALTFADRNSSLARKAVISFIWLFIGINSYQAVLGWFGALVLMAILAQTDFDLNRRAFGMGVTAMAVGGINAALNQLIPKLAQLLGVIESSDRHVSFSVRQFLFNGEAIYNSQKDFLKNGYYMLPDYFLFGALTLGVVLLFIAFDRHRIRRTLSVGVALGMGYLLTLVPHLLSSNLWMTLRTLPAVFLILSLMIVTAILCGTKRIRVLAFLLSLSVLLISSQRVSVIITDHMTTVHTDLAEGRAILHEIEKHERETGTKIEELCFLRDAEMQHCYPGVTTMWMDINPRHLTVLWEREPFMETISGRDFTMITLSAEEAEAIVQGRNWQYANYHEQMSFDGNRAYIILY